MEPKKKRGRPPKQKNNWSDSQQKEFDTDFKEKGYATTPNKGILAVNADQFEEFPDNWFSLSKVDKLAWLTAHKK